MNPKTRNFLSWLIFCGLVLVWVAAISGVFYGVYRLACHVSDAEPILSYPAKRDRMLHDCSVNGSRAYLPLNFNREPAQYYTTQEILQLLRDFERSHQVVIKDWRLEDGHTLSGGSATLGIWVDTISLDQLPEQAQKVRHQ